MITGANTNVRYRGILFHVQTEDSGRANPHIISHVYHGGTILGSQKTDYGEHLESDDLLGVVKSMIDEQHAAMVARLKAGGFDDEIQQRLGDTAVDAGLVGGEAPKASSRPDTQPDAAAQSRRPSGYDTAVQVGEHRSGAKQEPAPEPRAFGEGIGSSKPLDEVILDYLCDKARDRAPGSPGSTPSDGSER